MMELEIAIIFISEQVQCRQILAIAIHLCVYMGTLCIQNTRIVSTRCFTLKHNKDHVIGYIRLIHDGMKNQKSMVIH